MPHDSIDLVFPAGRTDGSSTKWPTDKLDPTPNADKEVNFMRPVAHDEPLSVKWRRDVGREVARLMGHADYVKYVLKDFPEGYKFYHHNKGPVHLPRTDPYLYGSVSGRYRSPQEFTPHAFWLMTDETLDRNKCRCKYCASNKKQKQISEELGLRSTIPGPSATRARPEVRHVAQPRKPLSRNVISHDRTADLRSTRRFRIGELVWCALSPAIRGSQPDECIEFWPGLVSETRLKNDVLPHAPGEHWRVVQSNVYKVKLLAVRQSDVLPETAILPYQAYGPPLNLMEPLRRAGDPTHLQNLQWLSQFNPITMGAELAGNSQLRFVEASTPFALAIQIAARLVRMWTPSDEWIFHGERPVPSSGPQPEDRSLLVSSTETRHQGLWWGAERIWVEELVRLQPSRSQVVPQGSQAIYRASPRADGRGVLMRINSIFAEPKSASRDAARECKIAGALYELAEAAYEEVIEDLASDVPVSASAGPSTSSAAVTNNSVISTDKSLILENSAMLASQISPIQDLPPTASSPINLPSFPAYPLPEPPSGYKFRQITRPGYEIVLDVSLIAGRYYPGLLKHPLLQDALADVDMNESRVTQLNALCGLLAGAINAMECIDWVGTRLAMINMADVKAQQDLHRHWHTSSPLVEHLEREGTIGVSSVHDSELQDVVMKNAQEERLVVIS